jgi:hypothetical protein
MSQPITLLSTIFIEQDRGYVDRCDTDAAEQHHEEGILIEMVPPTFFFTPHNPTAFVKDELLCMKLSPKSNVCTLDKKFKLVSEGTYFCKRVCQDQRNGYIGTSE